MKTKHFDYYLFMLIYTMLILFSNALEAQENIHYNTIGYDNEFTYMFRDYPPDMQYVTKVPFESLLEDSLIIDISKETDYPWYNYLYYLITVDFGDEQIVNYEVWYKILDNTTDMEVLLMENVQRYSLAWYNDIEYSLEEKIGHNCFYSNNFTGNLCVITFSRNNVLVHIAPENTREYKNDQGILQVAKKIDDLIVNTTKVADAKNIPSPQVQSIEVVSGNFEIDTVTYLKVNAVDSNNQNLRFRRLYHSTVENDTIWFHNSGKKTGPIKIFVENEDFVVSSYEYFGLPPR